MSDDEGEQDRDEAQLRALETAEGGWGARRAAYYGGDAPEADAEEEEVAEVRRQQEVAMGRMRAEDYMDSDEEDEEEDDASPMTGMVEAERVVRDPSRLTKNERLKIIAKESPELLDLLREFKSSVSQLKDQLEPLIERLRAHELPTEEGMSYLEVKHQVLLSYCTHIAFYLLLKARGAPVKDHPVIDRLIELRTLLERMRPLDQRLRYQIDKLMKTAATGTVTTAGEPLMFRPNPAAFVEDEEKEKGKKKKKRKVVEEEDEEEEETAPPDPYRPPHIAPVPYPGAERKERSDAARLRRKVARSQFGRDLVEEFSERPEVIRSVGVTREGVEHEESDGEKERRRFEEEHFVRISVPKEDRKRKARARQDHAALDGMGAGYNDIEDIMEGIDDMGGGGDDDLDALYAAATSSKSRSKRRKRGEDDGHGEIPWRGADEEFDEGSKRGATWHMLANKGSAPHRKSTIPRYQKAVVKRRTSGHGRERAKPAGPYRGERTGIKSRTVRSRKLK